MSNLADVIPVVLLVVLGLSLMAGATMVFFVSRELRRKRMMAGTSEEGQAGDFAGSLGPSRPQSWLAVRSDDFAAVQSALGLRHAKPCSWRRGLTGDEKLFISPPVEGWILVSGSGLPDPGDDVDACFRLVVETSRKLGHVQYFSANLFAHHHAWARAHDGRIVRAYAWAGTTVWNQGPLTIAEKELGLKCFDYAEPADEAGMGEPAVLAANAEKVPLLAARWSFDPARVNERLLQHAQGVAGEPSARNRHGG